MKGLDKESAVVLYAVCADYHSGQASRGYRLLCAAGRYLQRHWGIDRPLEFRVRPQTSGLYREIVNAYGDKL